MSASRMRPSTRIASFRSRAIPSENGCWLWAGYRGRHGYGIVQVEKRKILAHRFSLSLKLGRPITPGMSACHTCDVPLCVNPDHLYEGTHADNMREMRMRDRSTFGVRSHSARLRESDVIEIRLRYPAGGVTQRQLASEYGVNQSQIHRIIAGENWSRVRIPSEASPVDVVA